MDALDVSIIVPVYNHWDLTRACLESIRRTSEFSNLKAEVIVADDASTEGAETEARLPAGKWPVRYHRNSTNLGFLENVNTAAKRARGRLLCLLNSDTVVPTGWLDELVATMQSEPGAGAVGPAFVDPQNMLLECGCILRADGVSMPLGRSEPPGPPFDYLNDVDYISGACLLLPTELFRELGGFDPWYGRGYYEDCDLCLRIAERGLRVLVNPAVRVCHIEHGTHGRESAWSAIDANRVRFVERWNRRLRSRHPRPDFPVARMRSWRRQGTIVLHNNSVPIHDNDTASQRLWRIMQELRRRHYHVVLVCPGTQTDPYLLELRRLGVETVTAASSTEPSLERMVVEHEPLAAVFSWVESEQQFAGLYRALSPGTTRLFDTVDLRFVREARRAAVGIGMKGELRPTTRTIDDSGVEELICAARSDGTLVVSETERDLLIQHFHFDPQRLFVVSTTHEPAAECTPASARSGFAYLGQYGFDANVDAVTWLAGRLWPLIRGELTGAQLHLYGSRMTDAVRALHDPPGGVNVVGFVPDHRDALARARVMLAPLRFGAGIKGKIIEALAVGTPVVTTRVGAEGIDSTGEVLCVADRPEEFARLAVRLQHDGAEWKRRSELGRELVARKFSVGAAVCQLLEAIRHTSSLRTTPGLWQMIGRMVWQADDNHRDSQRKFSEFSEFYDSVTHSRSWRLMNQLNRLLRRGA